MMMMDNIFLHQLRFWYEYMIRLMMAAGYTHKSKKSFICIRTC